MIDIKNIPVAVDSTGNSNSIDHLIQRWAMGGDMVALIGTSPGGLL